MLSGQIRAYLFIHYRKFWLLPQVLPTKNIHVKYFWAYSVISQFSKGSGRIYPSHKAPLGKKRLMHEKIISQNYITEPIFIISHHNSISSLIQFLDLLIKMQT